MSDSSQLSENELIEIENQAKAKNTVRSTTWGVQKFTEWLEKRRKDCDFYTISPDALNDLLRQFYAEVKPSTKSKSKALTPSTMSCIRAAIRRHIMENCHRIMDIINDKEFHRANAMFTSKCKLYVSAGNPRPKHKPVIESGDMAKLSDYFNDYESNPTVLTEALWFHLCYFFGRRGREGWADLKCSSFKIQDDSEGKKYVSLNVTEVTKNHRGGCQDQDYSSQRMYGKGVDIFELFLKKKNPLCDRLFPYPSLSFRKNDDTWYKNAPIEKHQLEKIMKTISKKAQLSQEYTNHSVRATTITNLHRGGVESSRIISVTNHKNVQSLSHYIDGMSEAERQNCSDILSNALDGPNQNPTDTENYNWVCINIIL